MVQTGVAFVCSLFLMGMLLPEDFGRYALIAANISIVGAIMNLRIPDAVVRMPQAELDRLLGSLVAVQLGQIVLVIIVSVVVLSLFGLIGVYGLILVIALGLSDWIIFINKIYEREFEYRRLS